MLSRRKIVSHLPIIVLISSLILVTDGGVSVEEDLTLSAQQKEALDEFKARMLPIVDHEYKKKDAYLIRWLRARNFNVDRAQNMLEQDMEWRRREGIDTILEEDWTELRIALPHDQDGIDRNGAPLTTTDFDNWDLRRAILIHGERVHRYLALVFEEADVKVREMQAQGKLVTRFQWIANMRNFNLVQHGCLQCLPYYARLTQNLVTHYPNLANNIIVINAPQVFLPIVSVVRPILGEQYNKLFEVLGTNKGEWKPLLDSIADPKEFPIVFGGTKEVGGDFDFNIKK